MKQKEDIKEIYDPSLFNISELNILLHQTLKQTRMLLKAEAGTIYIQENNMLSFNVFQNDALSYEDIYRQFYAIKDIKLPLNQRNKYLAVECLLSKKSIVIDDVYNSKDYDFMGVKEFDKQFSYKTHSIITAPLIHPISEEGLGVIQILNKKENTQPKPFNKEDENLLSMVCSFIALSISKAKENFIQLQDLNKQLIETNKNLEERVEDEIRKNESKSAIIYNQSKMVSMGEMIGNIAHQWKQPLNAISIISSGLQLNTELNNINQQALSESLNQISDIVQHLSQTIDDFRNFYMVRKSHEQFNVAQAIKSCLSIVEATLNVNKVEVVLTLSPHVVLCGLKNEFTQSIISIINNAKDALMEYTNPQDKRYIFIDLSQNNTHIIITLKDNAGGINKNIIDKIFDQHFTTKDNKGNGIGLFISKQIVEEHMKGTLTAQNSVFEYNQQTYKGALFKIVLKQVLQ